MPAEIPPVCFTFRGGTGWIRIGHKMMSLNNVPEEELVEEGGGAEGRSIDVRSLEGCCGSEVRGKLDILTISQKQDKTSIAFTA